MIISNPIRGTGNHHGPKQLRPTTTGGEGKQSLPKSKVGLGQKIWPHAHHQKSIQLPIISNNSLPRDKEQGVQKERLSEIQMCK